MRQTTRLQSGLINLRTTLVLLCLTGLAGTVQAQSEDDQERVHWLYLRDQEAWVEDTTEVRRYPADISVPSYALGVWWETLADDLVVSRIRRDAGNSLEPGARVRTNQAHPQHNVAAGRDLSILQVLSTGLLLTDGETAFLVSPDDYRTLSFAVSHAVSDSLRIESEADAGERRFAWQTDQVQGSVHYDLDMADSESVTGHLRQRVRVTNGSDRDLSTRGFSYQPGAARHFPMRRDQTLQASAEADSGASESVAGYQAIITYPESVVIPPKADVWFPVSEQTLELAHRFQFQWHFNPVQNRAADWSLQLSSDTALQRLGGETSVSWFDGELASLNSQYQRYSENRAVVNLGQNDQLTLSARQSSESGDTWMLTLYNHLEQAADASLNLVFRQPGMNQSLSRTLDLRIQPGEHQVTLRAGPSGIEEL